MGPGPSPVTARSTDTSSRNDGRPPLAKASSGATSRKPDDFDGHVAAGHERHLGQPRAPILTRRHPVAACRQDQAHAPLTCEVTSATTSSPRVLIEVSAAVARREDERLPSSPEARQRKLARAREPVLVRWMLRAPEAGERCRQGMAVGVLVGLRQRHHAVAVAIAGAAQGRQQMVREVRTLDLARLLGQLGRCSRPR